MSDRVCRAALVFLTGVLVVASFVAMSCGDDERSAESTATPRRPTATPAVTSTPLPDIQTLDLANQQAVRDLAQQLNGEVAPEEIIYADLTGDGRDDAVVPISSGGTQGNLGFAVIGYLGGTLKALLTEAPSEGEVRVAVSSGQLVESLPVYAAGDLPGFPSSIRNVYYAWKGDQFAVDREEVIPNPNSPPRQ